MKDRPLPVAISAVIDKDRILLIKRAKGDYAGLLGLPGGKIEKDEHVSEAAIREVREESGIECIFKRHMGFVSEHLVENGSVKDHFMLHVCELEPKTSIIKNGMEGKIDWFRIGSIGEIRENIIPSDFLIIENIVRGGQSNYYNCVLEKSGNEYILRKFE